MSASTTVDIPESVKAELKKFRYRKASAGDTALVLKIDKKTLTLDIEDTLDGVTPDELAEELPENSPRFVVYSYKLNHKDGRVSFPLVLINWQPTTSPVSLSTLYASALSQFATTSDVHKVVDVRGEEDAEQLLTKDGLDKKLGA